MGWVVKYGGISGRCPPYNAVGDVQNAMVDGGCEICGRCVQLDAVQYGEKSVQ